MALMAFRVLTGGFDGFSGIARFYRWLRGILIQGVFQLSEKSIC